MISLFVEGGEGLSQKVLNIYQFIGGMEGGSALFCNEKVVSLIDNPQEHIHTSRGEHAQKLNIAPNLWVRPKRTSRASKNRDFGRMSFMDGP